jgi:hypothetical protein
MWPLNSFHGLALVKLQRPLPVIMIFLPGRGIFSRTMTFPEPFKVSAAPAAAISPAAPPPIMIMSAVMLIFEMFLQK